MGVTAGMDDGSAEAGKGAYWLLAFLAFVIVAAIALPKLTGASAEEANVEIVKRELRDPYSAQFSEVQTSGGITCGLVNSKNLMGAYTGVRLFVVERGTAYIGTEGFERSAKLDGVCSTTAITDALNAALRDSSL
ncbi:MAG: hypothetical protein WBF65_15385 [Sphingopyxis granuli]|uniref:hypothetical protein n=1 Tax=Sphingopyxis granuli TaxID=267128 RepID=UPI003C739210